VRAAARQPAASWAVWRHARRRWGSRRDGPVICQCAAARGAATRRGAVLRRRTEQPCHVVVSCECFDRPCVQSNLFTHRVHRTGRTYTCMTSTSLSCGRANAKSTHAKKRERAARPEAPASPLPPEVRLLHHPRTARRLQRAAHPLQPALPPFREEEESRRMAMSSMKVPNSSSKHSPVRPREAKPRIAVAGGTNGKVAVQPAAQEKHTGPREKHIEGRRGAAHGGKRGEKVDVLDKGGAPVRKRWRVRGVAGEARTGIRLLEDSDRALAGNHPSSVCRKKPRRGAGEEGDADGHVTFHDASAGVR
jgi:hypothetical protein